MTQKLASARASQTVMDAQASRFPDLRTFQTTELILFRKWPAPLDVIRRWMWYICITTRWRPQWSQLRCYKVLLKSSHLLWFSWAINVTDCMKCVMQKAVFAPDEPSPDLCAELLWRFSMRVCNTLLRLNFPRNAVTRVAALWRTDLSLCLRRSEREDEQWSEGLGDVIGTAWHYRMSPGVWRLAALPASPQRACWVMSDNLVYRTPLSYPPPLEMPAAHCGCTKTIQTFLNFYTYATGQRFGHIHFSSI